MSGIGPTNLLEKIKGKAFFTDDKYGEHIIKKVLAYVAIDDEKLEDARLCLVNSFKMTLEKSLDLLGIVAPSRM